MKRKLTKEELKQLLLHGGDEEIQTVISDIHPVMILDLLHEDIEAAPAYLSHLSDEVIADIVEEEDDEHKYELLKLNDESPQRLAERFPDCDEFIKKARNGELEKEFSGGMKVLDFLIYLGINGNSLRTL